MDLAPSLWTVFGQVLNSGISQFVAVLGKLLEKPIDRLLCGPDCGGIAALKAALRSSFSTEPFHRAMRWTIVA